ncbi:MAG TPA: hypothetical protein PK349_01815 [Candidatus Hydrogenedentes bacterium]|nr:hypothetical protein [Candidatus Hydrogenedentota bacterium]
MTRAYQWSAWMVTVLATAWTGAVHAQGPATTERDGVWATAPEYENFHVVVSVDASESELDAAADFCQLWKKSTRHDIDFDNTASGRINVWIGMKHLPDDLASQLEGETPGGDLCLIKTYVPPPRYAARGATKQLILAGDGELLRLTVRAFFRETLGVTWAAPGVTSHPRAGYAIPMMSARVRPAFTLREVDPRLYGAEEAEADQVRDFRAGVGLPRDPLPVPPAPLAPSVTTGTGDGSGKAAWGSPEAAVLLADRIFVLAGQTESSSLYQWPPGRGDWSLSRLQPDFAWPATAGDAMGDVADLLVKTACDTARLLEQRSLPEPWRIRVELPEGVTGVELPPDAPVHRLVLQLVPTHLDFFRDLYDRTAGANSRFRGDLKAWRNAGIRVHVVLPLAGRAHPASLFPVFKALGPTMMALHEEGVEGVYLGYPWGGISGKAPVLGSLRAYLAALLAFDCGLDPEILSRRFCVAYYGETAGGAVLEGIRLAEDAFRATGQPLALDDDGSWLTTATRQAIQERLAWARAKTGDLEAPRLDQLMQRVRAGGEME